MLITNWCHHFGQMQWYAVEQNLNPVGNLAIAIRLASWTDCQALRRPMASLLLGETCAVEPSSAPVLSLVKGGSRNLIGTYANLGVDELPIVLYFQEAQAFGMTL